MKLYGYMEPERVLVQPESLEEERMLLSMEGDGASREFAAVLSENPITYWTIHRGFGSAWDRLAEYLGDDPLAWAKAVAGKGYEEQHQKAIREVQRAASRKPPEIIVDPSPEEWK